MRARFLIALLVAVGTLCAPAAGLAYSSYPEIDETASWLAQRPVKVRCLTEAETEQDMTISFWGASAYVELAPDGGPKDYTVFEYGLCEKLHALFTQSWDGVYTLKGIAWAVLVLAHEPIHLRGWTWWKHEGKVNCHAIRHSRYVAQHLGADEHIATLIRDRAVWWFDHQPVEYQLEGCSVPR